MTSHNRSGSTPPPRHSRNQRDFSFIINKNSPGERARVIEHPAKTNKRHEEYRFCHPTQPRARVMNATFGELKDTLNAWNPEVERNDVRLKNVSFDGEKEKEILQKCLITGENIGDMVLIKASCGNNPNRPTYESMLKVIIFDKNKQLFLLRGTFLKHGLREYYPKPLKNPSQHPEWYVDLSTLLADGVFWSELKVLINSI